MYIMRSSGEPSSSGDNKSVLSLGFADKAYFRKVQYFSGSMSGSTSLRVHNIDLHLTVA